MAVATNLSSIVRHYAEKQNSAFIDFKEFCIYARKYAERHVEEAAELVKYLGDSTSTVTAELQGLSEKHLISVITSNNKKTIVSITYFSAKFAGQYKEILKNDSIPYPLATDLPKAFPVAALEKKMADQYIQDNIENQNTKSPALFIIEFSKEIPSIILPACVPIKVLIETAQIKIRRVLKKEDFHDYILKKLRSTNPAKEISIKNFFTHFVDQNSLNFFDFTQDDDFYLWNQALYFIRQDLGKIQDKTVEDINILQAVRFSEIYSVFLKSKFQEQQKRKEALKELENCLSQSPFFYSMPQILKFQDKNGRILYGQYSDDDLRSYLSDKTSDGGNNELPALLVFKVDSGTRYYVFKRKVIQVVVRLCNEAHESIEKTLEEKWYNSLLEYEHLPEMNNDAAFEHTLENLIHDNSPVLYALLTANFMNVLALEKDDDETMQAVQIFNDGKLLPYSKLLMLKNSSILSNAKANLPWIYTIPIISWIIALFNSKKIEKHKKDKKQLENDLDKVTEEKASSDKPQNKAEALANKAIEISKDLIPEGSTLDRELDYLIKQWNKMISKEAYNNLTEDVNALIRDYTRRVVRTLSAVSFTRERVENLAKTLVRTPNMQKINEEKALTEYVTLYILRLVSNSKTNIQ